MTLLTSDYLEYYLTLVGWIVSNGIWNILVASGMVALPFLAIILQEWLRARSEGADEGNKGVLSSVRIESRVFVAIVVILFAGIPIVPITLNTIEFDRVRSEQCQVTLAAPSETGWAAQFTELNNQTALVPIWWFAVHAISRGITGAAVAAVPCGTDLRQMRIDVNSARISDPVLSQEVTDFARDCYGPSRARLFVDRPTLGDALMDDVSWIGSTYYQDTHGFYDSHRSSSPRPSWPYDEVRDAGLAEVPEGWGYPTCKQWWADSAVGLRARLLQQVDPSLLQRFEQWAGFLTQPKVDDAVLRAIAAPRQQTLHEGQVYTDYGGQIDMTLPNVASRIAADIGLALGTVTVMPAMDAVRQALPMVLSLLKMALIICWPLILLMGTYDFKIVVIVSCVEFSLFFVDFWFQLARWVDSTIMNTLYGWDTPHSNFNALLGLNNGFGDVLLNFVLAAMFLVLPIFWIGALTWVGIHAGAVGQSLLAATGDAKTAAGRGGTTLLNAGK